MNKNKNKNKNRKEEYNWAIDRQRNSGVYLHRYSIKERRFRDNLRCLITPNVFKMINVFLPNHRSSISYTGRSSRRACDGSVTVRC